MYPGQEAKNLKSIGTEAIRGAAMGQCAQTIGPRDLSPIEMQLQRQSSLLNELHVVVSNVIDAIKPVMRYDPRESPQPETKERPVSASCALENEIELRNDLLSEKLRLLNLVREVICL